MSNFNIGDFHEAKRVNDFFTKSRERDRTSFNANAGGQSPHSSPIDLNSRGNPGIVQQSHDPNVDGSFYPVVHKQLGTFLGGQTLGSSDPAVQVSAFADDPEGQLGFTDTATTQQYVARITGVVHMRVSWLWGFLGGDATAGRFRTESVVKITRTRDGESVSVTYTDGRIGAKGYEDRIAWDCVDGDVFRVYLPHDGGDQTLDEDDPGEWQITVWQTGPPTLPSGSIVMSNPSSVGSPNSPYATLYAVGTDFSTTSSRTMLEATQDAEGGTAAWFSLAYDDQGRLWTCDHNGAAPDYYSSMVEVNPSDGSLVQRADAGDYDHYATAICWDPAIGKFRCHDGGGGLWTFDPDDGTYADEVSLPATPPTPAGGDDQQGWAYCLWVIGSDVWVASVPSASASEKCAIHRVNPSTGSVLESVTLPLVDGDGWAVIPEGSGTDGTYLYFTSPVDHPDGVTGDDTQVFAVDTSGAVVDRWDAPMSVNPTSGIAFPL